MMTIVIKCSFYLVCHTDSVITCNIGSRLVFYIFLLVPSDKRLENVRKWMRISEQSHKKVSK